MGFGTEILFVLMLGLLVLGPKRLHTILAHVVDADRPGAAQLNQLMFLRVSR